MFELLKPGHVLRYETDPGTIHSPGAKSAEDNNNTLESPWPYQTELGLVRCMSHPAGPLGAIAQVVAGRRTTPGSVSRSLSYSYLGRKLGASDRLVGTATSDFVGYADGQSNYVESSRVVISKDFSGCLMVAYTMAGRRRVAHVAASKNPRMDCKQAFLSTIRTEGATLIGWFRPFEEEEDWERKTQTYQALKGYMGFNINRLVTFGAVTLANVPYAFDAFRPDGHEGWVVTHAVRKELLHDWVVG